MHTKRFRERKNRQALYTKSCRELLLTCLLSRHKKREEGQKREEIKADTKEDHPQTRSNHLSTTQIQKEGRKGGGRGRE